MEGAEGEAVSYFKHDLRDLSICKNCIFKDSLSINKCHFLRYNYKFLYQDENKKVCTLHSDTILTPDTSRFCNFCWKIDTFGGKFYNLTQVAILLYINATEI